MEIVLLELRSKTEYDCSLNCSVSKTFYCDQIVSIFLISNVEVIEYTGGPCLLEQLHSNICGDDSNDEDFCVDNVNLRIASSSTLHGTSYQTMKKEKNHIKQ